MENVMYVGQKGAIWKVRHYFWVNLSKSVIPSEVVNEFILIIAVFLL